MELPHSKLPKFEASSNSDLLSRIRTFLPQMEQANENLQSEQIDENLVQEDSSKSDDEDASCQEPTIQLRLALGKTDENPAISWLADDDDSDDSTVESHQHDEEEDLRNASHAISTITNLLKQQEKPLSKLQGPRITEICQDDA